MPRWISFALSVGAVAFGIVACSPPSQPKQASQRASPVEPHQIVEAQKPAPESFPPSVSRNLNDIVAGCPHQNPEKRPRGSNCYGIFPEQCGADKAKAHIGEVATTALRTAIGRMTPNGDVRFIMPMEPMIEDLRYGRLNVHLDKKQRIVSVDCY